MWLEDLFEGLFALFVILLIGLLAIGLLWGLIADIINAVKNEETVQETIIDAEVINLYITSTQNNGSSTRHNYFVTVHNQEQNLYETFEVTEKAFSSLKVGEMITVEVKMIDNTHFPDEVRYAIVNKEGY